MSKKQNGKALREYMKRRGMRRQHELARDLKLSDPTICLYFQGKKSFSVKTALRIATHTGIPLEELYR